jgi:hypothetical protein
MSTLIPVKDIPLRVAVLCATVVLAALLIQTGAEAKGSWCASYDEGGTVCGFYSHQQCVDDVRGIGGICRPNFYRD